MHGNLLNLRPVTTLRDIQYFCPIEKALNFRHETGTQVVHVVSRQSIIGRGELALGPDQEDREALTKAQFQPGGSPTQVHLDPESQAGTG